MKANYQKIIWISIGLLLFVLFSFLIFDGDSIFSGKISSVLAAPDAQLQIYTPTPGPDGRIIYIVQANDTLISISLLTGVSIDELKGLNNLLNEDIFEGQELLIGLAGPEEKTPTPGPTPTPTTALPTPTTKPGRGTLCILLFDDLNGDSIRQESEPSIPGGAISFGNRDSTISETVDTGAGLDPQCFEDIPEGDYSITVAIPEGYNPTTITNFELKLNAGDETYLNFGAQANSQTQAEQEIIPQDGGKSPILGIVGALFLLAGIGVALFAGKLLKG